MFSAGVEIMWGMRGVTSWSALAVAAALPLVACGAGPAEPSTTLELPPGVPHVPTPMAAAPPPQAHTPSRLRRLSNRELGNVLRDLLGPDLDLTRGLLPDARVGGQDTDVLALAVTDSKVEELAAIAERAGALVSSPETLPHHAPCLAREGPVAESCARFFAHNFAGRAWGRPPGEGELAGL